MSGCEWIPDEPPHLRPSESAGAVCRQEIELAVRNWLGAGASLEETSPASMILHYPDGGHYFFSIAELLVETCSLSADSRRQQVRVFISELPADSDEAGQRTNNANLSVAVAPAGRFDALGSCSRGKVSLRRAHPLLDAALAFRSQEGDLIPMSRTSLRDTFVDRSEPELWDHALANVRAAARVELRHTGTAARQEAFCGWRRPFADGDLALAILLLCPDLNRETLGSLLSHRCAVWLTTQGPLFFSGEILDLDRKLDEVFSTVLSDPDIFLIPWPLTLRADGVLGAGLPEACAAMDRVFGPGMRFATAEGHIFQTEF